MSKKSIHTPWSNAYRVDTPFVGTRILPQRLFWQCCSLPFIEHRRYMTSVRLGKSLAPKHDLACHLPPWFRDLITISTSQVTQDIIYKQETIILISQYSPLILLCHPFTISYHYRSMIITNSDNLIAMLSCSSCNTQLECPDHYQYHSHKFRQIKLCRLIIITHH